MVNRLVEPQNHGPSCRILSLASGDGNLTTKKPLEQRWMSHSNDQFAKIQWKSSTGLGQKQLNRQIIARDSREAHCSSDFGMLMFNFGLLFSCSTI